MTWALVVFGALAALPATAGAAARYASPTASGTMDCSSPANACDVKTAIESAGMDDDVYVPGNLGDYHVSSSISPAATPVHIHGTDGRPRLILAGRLTLKGPSTAEDLYIEGPGTTFGLHSPAGGSADNVIVKVTDTGHACYFSGGHTLTNSVCWAASKGDLAVETDGSNTFRNDTFVGGTEAAIKGFARNPDCSCAAATDTLVNVIARSGGSGHDLEANSDNSADMTFDVTYSNYAKTVTTGLGAPAKTHIDGDATDQSAAPLFVGAASGDFHEAPGSPTIDTGVNDLANGTTDFDGDPRVTDGTTDIGADEFESGLPTPTPRPSPATLDHFFSYGVKATKGNPSFAPIGPVTLADRFATRSYDIIKATTLLLPANKNTGGVHDDVTHLLEYAVKPSQGAAKFVPPPDVHVLNQCSDVALVPGKPVSVLVPTAKDLTSPPNPPVEANHQLDHFLCYAAKPRLKLGKGIQVDVADQFQTRRYDLKKIDTLCVPVAKSGTPVVLKGPGKGTPATITPADVRHPEALLVCYQAKLATTHIPQLGCGPVDPKRKGTKIVPKQPRHTPRIGIFVANQLGALQLDSTKEVALCVPSLSP